MSDDEGGSVETATQQSSGRVEGQGGAELECSAVQQGGGGRFLPDRLHVSVLKLLEQRRWTDRDSTPALQQQRRERVQVGAN